MHAAPTECHRTSNNATSLSPARCPTALRRLRGLVGASVQPKAGQEGRQGPAARRRGRQCPGWCPGHRGDRGGQLRLPQGPRGPRVRGKHLWGRQLPPIGIRGRHRAALVARAQGKPRRVPRQVATRPGALSAPAPCLCRPYPSAPAPPLRPCPLCCKALVDIPPPCPPSKGHNCPVWDVAMSPLGHYFVSGGSDKSALLWATERSSPLRTFGGHQVRAAAAAAADVTAFVGCRKDGAGMPPCTSAVSPAPLPCCPCLLLLPPPLFPLLPADTCLSQADVDCVTWHPNCHYVATGSSDRTVRLWDLKSGRRCCCCCCRAEGPGRTALAVRARQAPALAPLLHTAICLPHLSCAPPSPASLLLLTALPACLPCPACLPLLLLLRRFWAVACSTESCCRLRPSLAHVARVRVHPVTHVGRQRHAPARFSSRPLRQDLGRTPLCSHGAWGEPGRGNCGRRVRSRADPFVGPGRGAPAR